MSRNHMGAHSEATSERGREEWVGRGDAGRNDTWRADQAGRHYGRTGHEQEGPGGGLGPLQEQGRVDERYGHRELRGSEWGGYGRHELHGLEGTGYGDRWTHGDVTASRREHQAERRGAGRRPWRSAAERVRDVMTTNPTAARREDTLQRVAQIMADDDCGIVPVVDDGQKLVGVVTDRDIVTRGLGDGRDPGATRVADVMTTGVECVSENDSVADVLRRMTSRQLRRMCVVDRANKLLGIVSVTDLAREADANPQLQKVFLDIAAERGFWTGMT